MFNPLAEIDAPKEQKALRDMSKATEAKINEAKQIKKEKGLMPALEHLLTAEKQARLAEDVNSTCTVLECILSLCFEDRNFDCIKEYLVILSKRRGQLRKAIAKMIQRAAEYIDALSTDDEKLDYIEVIRSVTSGKIFVELEGARVTKIMCDIYEGRGDLQKAKDLLLELTVETYASMDISERITFILEQTRLCLATKDPVRANIIAKKIHPNIFKDGKLDDLKLRYHQLLIQLAKMEDKQSLVCRHYKHMYDLAAKQATGKAESIKHMEKVILFGILSEYSPEALDFLHIIAKEPVLREMPTFRHLLKLFIKCDLISIPDFEAAFSDLLSKHDSLLPKHLDLLKTRIIEHNCRTVARYYSTIEITRFAQLVGIDPVAFEDVLASAIIEKMVRASINRPNGTVSFLRPAEPDDHLNAWLSDVNKLLNLVEKSSHLITLARAKATV